MLPFMFGNMLHLLGRCRYIEFFSAGSWEADRLTLHGDFACKYVDSIYCLSLFISILLVRKIIVIMGSPATTIAFILYRDAFHTTS